MHIFVNTGYGVKQIEFTSIYVSGAQLKEVLRDTQGIPCNLQRLKCGTSDLQDEQLLASGSTINLCLRLNGGKGGFGSNLRGGQVGGRKVRTRNKESMRDLNGRRIRDVRAEEELAEWLATAKEREEKKLKLKAQMKKQKERPEYNPDLTAFRELQADALDSVSTAVEKGLKEAQELAKLERKRKKEEERLARKRTADWDPFLAELSDSDEDSEGSDNTGESDSGEDSAASDENDEEMTGTPSTATSTTAAPAATTTVPSAVSTEVPAETTVKIERIISTPASANDSRATSEQPSEQQKPKQKKIRGRGGKAKKPAVTPTAIVAS